MIRDMFGSVMLLSALVGNVAAEETPNRGSFGDYLDGLKQLAIEKGINQSIIDTAFVQIKPFKKAVVSDTNELHSAKPQADSSLETYLPTAVPEDKVVIARALFKANHNELTRISEKYGVQPRFIVALWGLESDFGGKIGSYPVLSVTSSLAYQGTDEAFYRSEFIAALKILEQGQLNFDELTSSWTGTMGQTQFTPSTYLAFAQDGDGDGKKDIWGNQQDAFASIAYYLQQAGWKAEETWGRQVKLPDNFDPALTGLNIQKSFNQWQALGVRRYDGSDLPDRDDMQTSLVMPDGIKGRKYLVYDNYRALMKRQTSDYFALTVTYLSERIKYPAIN